MHRDILLIDDSKPIHALVMSLLEDEEVTVHSAYDAQFGIVLAESLQPDLILLDVEMPGVDGFETCRLLKANPATAGLPIIFLTSRAATEEMVRGLDLGASDYVTKPFKLSELVSRVRAALRTSQLIRLLEEKALIDSLTGLGNRAMFDARFAAEVSLRIKSGHPLSCIAVDADHFKALSDEYGIAFGERVLSKIGNVLSETCRDEDVACRVASHGFVILAPQSTTETAVLLVQEMSVAIAKTPLTCQGKSITVTCSFGIAEAVGLYDRTMLERAEEAAIQSRKTGPNRFAIAPPPPAPSTVAA